MKTLLTYLLAKGTLIGFTTALFKIMYDIRTGNLKWKIALTDLIGSTVMGYSVFTWASESDTLASWQVIVITVFLSINTFLVIKIVTEPKIVKTIIKNWFKITETENEEK